MDTRLPHRLLALALTSLVAAGCGGVAESGGRDSLTHREVIGDTTFVEIGADSLPPLVAVEDLAIGTLDGPEHLTFGMVTEMVPDDEGGIYVFDGNAPALRYFDTNGAFVRTLGGQGGGPGEYEDVALGLAIRSDDRIVMRDPRNGRLNVYNPDGSYADAWTVASGLFTAQAMTIDTLDHIYLKILTARPVQGEPWPVALLHLDDEGTIVDTIPQPVIEGEPTDAVNGRFLPQKHWVMTRYGQFVVGVSDQYRFEIRNPDGTVIRVSKAWDPVPLAVEEKREWQAMLDEQWERQREFMTSPMEPVPDHKPAYQGFYGGVDGTIWVNVYVSATKRTDLPDPGPDGGATLTWREPRTFDVFDATGNFLGRVQIPRGTGATVFSRTTLWGIRRGDFDEPYVVRLAVSGLAGEMLESTP